MYILAFACLLLSLLTAVAGGGLALLQLWHGRGEYLRLVEKAHYGITGMLLLASALLLHALFWNDFSVQYVASYTDRLLPVFYRLTAFWAGQPGSLLFWALAVALSGTLFACTLSYRMLGISTRLWYWAFFYALMAFFALLLTTGSNPFVLQSPTPPDGNGLNPLLQNPGMIFHPPLLFLGYGGFAVPACLALAQTLAGRRPGDSPWYRSCRPCLLLSWLSLTAGILLGAWWAYMELGWGGYWAWDPVENASLLPWLVATAALHTLCVEERRHKLGRVNVALMALTTVAAFFATYVVRSGVIDSVHAFGSSNLGFPLLLFVLIGTVLALAVPFSTPAHGSALAGPVSREGILTLTAWIFLSLAAIILTATLWPVISALWSSTPQGLDARFYNRVCLPLGASLVFLMALCPWLGWKGGIRRPSGFFAVVGVMVGTAALLFFLGYRHSLTFVGAAAAAGVILGVLFLMWKKHNVLQRTVSLSALGIHTGLALFALGVAISGPYTVDGQLTLAQGEHAVVEDYTFTLLDVEEGRRSDHTYLAARLRVSQGSEERGILIPERRIYDKFGTMQFSEVDVIPSLGTEIYASLLGLDTQRKVVLKVSLHPLVNWLWIGGVLMCCMPLLGLQRRRSRTSAPVAEESLERA